MSIWFRLPKYPVHYQMEIITFDESAEIQENKLVYKMVMTQKKETLNGYLVNIKRSDVLLNDTIDQPPLTEILCITAKVFHDLDLEISNLGTILKVQNRKEIQERWKEIRFKIDHTYTGNIVEPVMQSMDKIVENEDLFLKSLQKDTFFYYYFLIYGNYNNYELFRKDIPLYGFGGNKPISVDAHLSHTKEKKDGISVAVNLKLQQEKEQMTTNMSGNYTLLADQRHIETMDFLLETNRNNLTIKKMQLILKKAN